MTPEEAAKDAAVEAAKELGQNTLMETMANGSIPELEPLALLTLSMRLRNFSLFKEKALKGKSSLVPAQRVFLLEAIPMKVGRKAPKKMCFALFSHHSINGAGDVNLVTINNSIRTNRHTVQDKGNPRNRFTVINIKGSFVMFGPDYDTKQLWVSTHRHTTEEGQKLRNNSAEVTTPAASN